MGSFCSKCGTEIPIGEGFCPKCGNMVSFNSISQPLQPQINVASNVNDMNNRKKKQSVVGIVGGILGIVGILLSLFGIGAFFGFAAVILGIVGVAKKRECKIGMAVTGIVTGGTAILVGLLAIIMTVITYNAQTCKERGCSEPVYANGYCSYHYYMNIGEDILKGIFDILD